jgi:hypothetical protein
MPQYRTLPKWAQQEINGLTADLRAAHNSLIAFRAESSSVSLKGVVGLALKTADDLSRARAEHARRAKWITEDLTRSDQTFPCNPLQSSTLGEVVGLAVEVRLLNRHLARQVAVIADALGLDERVVGPILAAHANNPEAATGNLLTAAREAAAAPV